MRWAWSVWVDFPFLNKPNYWVFSHDNFPWWFSQIRFTSYFIFRVYLQWAILYLLFRLVFINIYFCVQNLHIVYTLNIFFLLHLFSMLFTNTNFSYLATWVSFVETLFFICMFISTYNLSTQARWVLSLDCQAHTCSYKYK